jgi:hypothetical protein
MLIAIAIGCTDLNEDIYSGIPDEEYPQTQEQANAIPLESLKAMADLFDDNGYWYLSQEISSDELVGPTRAADWYDGGKWLELQYHSWSNQANSASGMWNKLYQGIQESNTIVDQIGTITSPIELKSKAEVETIRSLYYFWLMDNFGDVPYLTSFSSAPEQPFKLNRAAIFDSLTATLDFNYPLMSSMANSGYKSFASKELALALLAKLYLNGEVYTGSAKPEYYQKTIQYCDSLLSYSHLSLEPNVMDLFKKDKSAASKEIIFMVPFDEVSKTGFRLHMRSLGYISKETFNMNAQPWNGFCVIPTFFDKYEATDLRRDGYFLHGPQVDFQGAPLMDAKTGKQIDFDPYIKIPWMSVDNMAIEGIDNFEMTYSGARVQKYEVYAGALVDLTVNFPVFRLADVVFMKAEAELKLNGSVSAETMVLVNEIWTRANQTPPVGGLTLDNILDERGKELFAEGHRRNDMIRFGTFDKPFWAMGQTDMTGVSAPNDIQNVFPIPQGALDSNPNLGEPAQ